MSFMNASYSFIKIWKTAALLSAMLFLVAHHDMKGQQALDLAYPGLERYLEYGSIASSNFLKDSTYVFKDENGSWNLVNRLTYKHDLQGNEMERLESEFIHNAWVNQLRVEKAYDSSQNLTYERISVWDQKHETWGFHEKKDFFYNTVDYLETEIVQIREGNLWEQDKKNEYAYYEDYNVQSISEFEWESETQEWKPTERTLFEYTESDNVDREIIQVWDDSLNTWLNSVSKDYTYDEDDNLISSTRSNWSALEQSWVDISMISLIYNDKGQVQGTRQIDLSPSSAQNLVSQDVSYDEQGNPGETIISNWNPDEEEWQNVTKKVHFWSENLTGNLSSSSDQIVCSFMNPYFLGLMWKCSSLKDDILYTVEVRDLWGRSFFADQFMGNRAFRIDGNIPPGVYIVIIRGGLDVHTEKVIIKG